MKCDRCNNDEKTRYLRVADNDLLCPDCFDQFIIENENDYYEKFANENKYGFLLTYLKCGLTDFPMDDEWWMDTIEAGLEKLAKFNPEDVKQLKKEYAIDCMSDFEDYIVYKKSRGE